MKEKHKSIFGRIKFILNRGFLIQHFELMYHKKRGKING